MGVRITSTILGHIWEGELDALLASNTDLDAGFARRAQALKEGETLDYFADEWFSLSLADEEKENKLGLTGLLTHSTCERHSIGSLLTFNLPELFERPDFTAYVNKEAGNGLATWHTSNDMTSVPLGEYADVFIQADISLQESGWEIECSEEFPEPVLTLLADTVGNALGEWHGIIRLTNLPE